MEKKRNNKPKKQGRDKLLIATAIFIFLLGLGYASLNLYHFSRGFFAEWFYTSSIQAEEFAAPTTEEKDALTQLDTVSEAVLYKKRPETGDQFGELYIPKLDETLPIFEGTSEEELDLGVGHFADSVLPGERDNSVLAGHRDTVFRKLGEVGEGDSLIVRTSIGEFEYVVNKVRIVDKDDRTVIIPKPKATLTVSTCYPFEYIGSAPQRYILVAFLASQSINN